MFMITLSFSSIDVAVGSSSSPTSTSNILSFTVPPNLPDPPLCQVASHIPQLSLPKCQALHYLSPLVSFPTRPSAIHNGP
ncbi:hypothetical protein NC652_019915 [Populus alba x Populus x berolinensis]|nr:hypothetical protein NC652_019915 [Populus alba x Populus x berolinensis]